MTRKISRILSLVLVLSLLFTALPVTASAALADYDPTAVSAINGMITNNGLDYSVDDPVSWDFATWDDSVPKQLIGLDLYDKGLSGDLALTDLTSLEVLLCGYNQLTRLDVTDCTALNDLSCV